MSRADQVAKDLEFEQPDRYPGFAVKKFKIGPKSLSIKTRYDNESITFERGVQSLRQGLKLDDFSITVRKQRVQKVMKTCSLGCQHEVQEKGEYQLALFHFTWEEAEMLFEWFQQGSYRKIREAKASVKEAAAYYAAEDEKIQLRRKRQGLIKP